MILSVRIFRFRVWIPLFLIWPIAVVIWIALLPFAVLFELLRGKPRRAWFLVRLGSHLFRIFAATRGLSVDVDDGDRRIFVSFR